MVEVTEGLLKVTNVTKWSDCNNVTVYVIHTEEKHPEVISWGRDSIVLSVPDSFTWKPSDFTIVRFGETKTEMLSVYLEDKYQITFIQYPNTRGEVVWDSSKM